jgi:hypothetical protein
MEVNGFCTGFCTRVVAVHSQLQHNLDLTFSGMLHGVAVELTRAIATSVPLRRAWQSRPCSVIPEIVPNRVEINDREWRRELDVSGRSILVRVDFRPVGDGGLETLLTTELSLTQVSQ